MWESFGHGLNQLLLIEHMNCTLQEKCSWSSVCERLLLGFIKGVTNTSTVDMHVALSPRYSLRICLLHHHWSRQSEAWTGAVSVVVLWGFIDYWKPNGLEGHSLWDFASITPGSATSYFVYFILFYFTGSQIWLMRLKRLCKLHFYPGNHNITIPDQTSSPLTSPLVSGADRL